VKKCQVNCDGHLIVWGEGEGSRAGKKGDREHRQKDAKCFQKPEGCPSSTVYFGPGATNTAEKGSLGFSSRKSKSVYHSRGGGDQIHCRVARGGVGMRILSGHLESRQVRVLRATKLLGRSLVKEKGLYAHTLTGSR